MEDKEQTWLDSPQKLKWPCDNVLVLYPSDVIETRLEIVFDTSQRSLMYPVTAAMPIIDPSAETQRLWQTMEDVGRTQEDPGE